jgi:uncharacterized protein (TIGR02145 family)/uncharacterized repeat protein (TIGR02543 family)
LEDYKLTSLPTPTRDDYLFNGWFTAATGGEAVTINDEYSDDATIYAQWIPTFTDSRDGTVYKKVTIGTQTWMAENLNYDGTENGGTAIGVCYNNSADSCSKYGRLYNWATAMDNAAASTTNPSGVQGACPAGWHLPSNAEWTTLTTFVGTPTGTKLKSTSGWNNDGNGTDEYGFSALPGGQYLTGVSRPYSEVGTNGSWWTTSTNQTRSMSNTSTSVSGGSSTNSWYSVRCVQD